MSRNVANIYVETRRSDYKDILPTHSVQSVFDAAEGLSEIGPLLDKLFLNWRAAAYLAAMPICFVPTSGPQTILASLRSDEHVLSVTELLLAKLQQKVGEISADPGLRSRLRVACIESVEDYRKSLEHLSTESLEESHWQMLISESVFMMYIWYSQRACYMFAVAAFEHFLVGVIEQGQPGVQVKASDRDFPSRLRAVIGATAERASWSGNEAVIRREVRHTLAHKSGIVTDRFSRQTHKFIVTNGLLQIGVSNNKQLFSELVGNLVLICSELKSRESGSVCT